MKIRPEEAQSLHADTDRQPKMMNLISALQQLRQRVPPRPKKRERISSANRVGTTSEHSLRHPSLMSIRLLQTYALPLTSRLLTILSMYGYTEQAV